MMHNSIYYFREEEEEEDIRHHNKCKYHIARSSNESGWCAPNMYDKTSKKLYSQRYRKIWENDQRFKGWLQPVPGDETKAVCNICGISIQAHMKSLLVHNSSKKHLDRIKSSL
ncbi:hypothetical protein SK128_000250, partial [Halocaridina rubra]